MQDNSLICLTRDNSYYVHSGLTKEFLLYLSVLYVTNANMQDELSIAFSKTEAETGANE